MFPCRDKKGKFAPHIRHNFQYPDGTGRCKICDKKNSPLGGLYIKSRILMPIEGNPKSCRLIAKY